MNKETTCFSIGLCVCVCVCSHALYQVYAVAGGSVDRWVNGVVYLYNSTYFVMVWRISFKCFVSKVCAFIIANFKNSSNLFLIFLCCFFDYFSTHAKITQTRACIHCRRPDIKSNSWKRQYNHGFVQQIWALGCKEAKNKGKEKKILKIDNKTKIGI